MKYEEFYRNMLGDRTIPEVRNEFGDNLDFTDSKAVTEWLRDVPDEQTGERDRIARLFACDCAESVLPIWQAVYPADDRPAKAIETARRFAIGEATEGELSDARDAAWDAAWDAATRDATRAATWAARAATWAARAARDARDAEREKQIGFLRKYLMEGNQ